MLNFAPVRFGLQFIHNFKNALKQYARLFFLTHLSCGIASRAVTTEISTQKQDFLQFAQLGNRPLTSSRFPAIPSLHCSPISVYVFRKIRERKKVTKSSKPPLNFNPTFRNAQFRIIHRGVFASRR